MTAAEPTFLFSYILDGQGRGQAVEFEAVTRWTPDQGKLWVHLDVNDSASRRWLANHSGLSEAVVDTLLAEETRPRSVVSDHGLLVVLRGVNTNPGEDPEDMVSVRVWIESDRIISSRRRQLLSVIDVSRALDNGTGPTTSGEFLTALMERLADRIGEFVESIDDRLDTAEDDIVTSGVSSIRPRLAALRRQIAAVRRFLAPQRDALDRLVRQPTVFLAESDAQLLRQEADRVTRYLEDLDLGRERAIVLQEELLSRIAQEQNVRMYVLSVVAAIFLPLTFITGLLGMNVGGLPGLESPFGFLGSVLIMIAAAAGLAIFFRWKKWL